METGTDYANVHFVWACLSVSIGFSYDRTVGQVCPRFVFVGGQVAVA